jgi:hypothetical protein
MVFCMIFFYFFLWLKCEEMEVRFSSIWVPMLTSWCHFLFVKYQSYFSKDLTIWVTVSKLQAQVRFRNSYPVHRPDLITNTIETHKYVLLSLTMSRTKVQFKKRMFFRSVVSPSGVNYGQKAGLQNVNLNPNWTRLIAQEDYSIYILHSSFKF